MQCSYIGHPQTSGFPTIDYFLSGELIEPANGQDHYSEKLVKLPNVGFHYEPLELPPVTVTREELGLRPNSTAYWCAQSLFKYLPQHDEVFPRIAREAGDCQFVFIRHFGRDVTELFQKRLDRAFAAAGLKAEDHCVFLNGMDMNRFAAASAQCDLMLDSIGWSGGNTTLEALAQDLPVVTFQGELMRGRVSAGILRMMGMPETIAETLDDYVALAVRIGRDPSLAGRHQKAHRQRQAPALPRPRLHRRVGRFPRPRRAPASLDKRPRGAANARLQIPHHLTPHALRVANCARQSWLARRCFSWLANAEKQCVSDAEK